MPEGSASMNTSTRTRWLLRSAFLAACWLLCAVLIWGQPGGQPAPQPMGQMPAPSLRDVTGTVTDEGHEPIRGAVVELRNTKTNEVSTYLTDQAGHYTFKRLDGHTDYEIWVIFRGNHSPTRSISMFDNHTAKTIDFKIKPY
jgi:hypothetical protein